MKKLSPVLGLLIALWGCFSGSAVYGLDLVLLNGKVIKNCTVENISESAVRVFFYRADGKREFYKIERKAISRKMLDSCQANLNERELKEEFWEVGDDLQDDFRKNTTEARYRKSVANAVRKIEGLLEKNAEDITVEKILELSGGVLVRVVEVQKASCMVPGEMILICNIEAPEEDLFRCTVYNIFAVTDLEDYGVVKMYDFDIESAAVAIRKMLSLQARNSELFYSRRNSRLNREVLAFDPETEVEYIITKRGVTAIFVERGNRARRRNIISCCKRRPSRAGSSQHGSKYRKPVAPGKGSSGKTVPRVAPRKKTGGGTARNPETKVTPRRPSRKPRSSTKPIINKKEQSGRNLPNLPKHKHPGSTRPAKNPRPMERPIIRKEENLRLPNLPEHKHPGSTRPR